MTVSLLPGCAIDYVMGINIMSHWGTFPLPDIVKQRAYKSVLQAMLIKHAKGDLTSKWPKWANFSLPKLMYLQMHLEEASYASVMKPNLFLLSLLLLSSPT